MFKDRKNPASQTGFSLIEVMIAMLVMAIGAAGLAVLLLSSVQGTAQAQDRSFAAIGASELAQLIHANPASLGHFLNADVDSQICEEDSPCPGNWASSHLQSWQIALEHQVAMSKGAVCRDSSPLDGDILDIACDGVGEPVVKIVWQEASRSEAGLETRRVVLPLPSQ